MTGKVKKENKCEGAEKYLKELFSLIRKTETLAMADKKTRFNGTEIRLLGEILNAKYIGKRLISTQLAKSLGVTRSAISQIVNRLEKQGVVQRVDDDIDRKIAYIELTEEALEAYGEDLKVYVEYVGKLVEKFGEERFYTMCSLFDEFYQLVEKERVEKLKDKKRK